MSDSKKRIYDDSDFEDLMEQISVLEDKFTSVMALVRSGGTLDDHAKLDKIMRGEIAISYQSASWGSGEPPITWNVSRE